MIFAELSKLKSKSLDTRLRAAEKLASRVNWNMLTRSFALRPLIALMESDDNENVRYYAANALGNIGDPRAVEALIAALPRTFQMCGGESRNGAAYALGRIRDRRAVLPLIELLNRGRNEPHPWRRKSWTVPALWALGDLGDLRAVGTIYSLAMWWQPMSSEASAAATRLARLKSGHSFLNSESTERDLGFEEDKLELIVISGSPSAEASSAFDALKEIANGKILTEPENAESSRIIINDVSDWPECVAFVAPTKSAEEPGKIGELVTSLGHDEPSIRVKAAASLARIGDSRAADALLSVLTQPVKQKEESRHAAAKTLGVIGAKNAIPGLVAALKDPCSCIVRYEAALSLGSIGEASAVPGLIGFIEESTPDMVRRVIAVSEGLTAHLYGRSDKESLTLRRAGLAALGAICDSRAQQFLAEALRDGEDGVRGTAEAGLLLHKILQVARAPGDSE